MAAASSNDANTTCWDMRRDAASNRAEDLEHGVGVSREVGRLLAELPPAGGSQLVVLGLAIVLGKPPVGADPAARLEAVERHVQRPILDLDRAVARLLDPAGDGIAMPRPPAQGLEDEGVEGAL